MYSTKARSSALLIVTLQVGARLSNRTERKQDDLAYKKKRQTKFMSSCFYNYNGRPARGWVNIIPAKWFPRRFSQIITNLSAQENAFTLNVSTTKCWPAFSFEPREAETKLRRNNSGDKRPTLTTPTVCFLFNTQKQTFGFVITPRRRTIHHKAFSLEFNTRPNLICEKD